MSRSLVDLFRTNDFILFQDALHRKKTKAAKTIFHKMNHDEIAWDITLIRTMASLQLNSEICLIKNRLSVECLESLVIQDKMDELCDTWKKKLFDKVINTDNPVQLYKIVNHNPGELSALLQDCEFFHRVQPTVAKFLWNLGYEHGSCGERYLDRSIIDFISRLHTRALDYIFRNHLKIFYLKDVHENNLLHYAIFDNNEQLITYVLGKKIDILNQKNMWFLTPLHEAMRLQLYNITHLLREHGASMSNKRDSMQSIIGKRTEFFQKLEVAIDFVPTIFSECVLQLFHSQTSNNNLYCCSLKYCHKTFQDFHEAVSKMTFEKDYLQNRKHVENCHLLSQREFFLSPVCRDHHIKHMHTFSFCIGPTFLGIFVVWVNKNIDRAYFESFFSFIRYFMLDDYKVSFRIFPTFYSHLSTTTYYKNRFQASKIKLSSPLSTDFIPAVRFFSNFIDQFYDIEVYNYLWILKKCHSPVTPLSTEIYGLLSDLDLPVGGYPSHLFRQMYAPLKLPTEIQDIEERQPPIPLSVFDLYEIIGENHDPVRNVAPFNDLISNKLEAKDLYYTLIHLLFGSDEFRTQPVIGTGTGNAYRVFLPVEEIRPAMDALFDIQEKSLLLKLFRYYNCLLEWIHPLTDGNGRSARLLITIYLRARGIPVIVHAGNKILSFQKFQDLIMSSKNHKN